MPRATIVPRYLKHKKSNSAYTYHRLIKTPDHRTYLGKWNSPESAAKYAEICSEIAEIEQRIAKERTTAKESVSLSANPSLNELALAYQEHLVIHYKRGDSLAAEYASVWRALEIFLQLWHEQQKQPFGDLVVKYVGPRLLKQFLKTMAESGYARSYVNHQLTRVKGFFKWISEEELVAPETYHKLTCVGGLQQGEFGCFETPGVRPAPLQSVAALRPFVSPVISDMMEVQYLCATRPDEVCRMRGCDIDRSGDIWIYTPEHHKNEWRGQSLCKAIPLAAQPIIARRIARYGDGYLFPPAEGVQWSLEQRTAPTKPGRKTKVYPCELKQRAELKAMRRLMPKRKTAGPHYTTDSYRGAADYGFKRAKRDGVSIERFTPNQLRHSIVTLLSSNFGRERAQVYAGHESLDTTAIYDEKTVQDMKAVARQLDALLKAS